MSLPSTVTHMTAAATHMAAPARLRGRSLLLARAAWVSVALISLALFLMNLPYAFAGRQIVCATACLEGTLSPSSAQAIAELGFTLRFYAAYIIALDTLFALVYMAVGAWIFWRKSDEPMALFVALALVLFGATWPIVPDLLASAPWAVQALAHVWTPLGFTALGLLIYLFPDGRFVPRWTRWPALLGVVWPMAQALLPGTPIDQSTWPALLRGAVSLTLFGTLVVAQVYRYMRASSAVQRQQTKWVAFGVAITIVGGASYLLLGTFIPALDQPGRNHLIFDMVGRTIFGTFTLLLIPLAIAVAILRHRLWDIDILINRTLVYAALTAAISGIYVLVVGGLGALFQSSGSLLIALLGAGLVAALFQPLRERLQRGVNRLIYGERDDPYAAISRLSLRLEAALAPDTVLPTIVQTLQETLKLPYVALALTNSAEFSVLSSEFWPPATQNSNTQRAPETQNSAVSSGKQPAYPLTRLPLVYQHETVGQLILAPRAAGETFSPADRRLLDDLARQAGVAVHAVRLTADLQHSRERLVTAREEERRRLRRDLHDGLGPALATLTLQAEAARDLIPSDPQRAAGLLDDLIGQSQTAIADIRRLVYDLRPPALDDLGFVGALRALAARYDHGAPRVTVDAPADLPALPAAVEVAAYRIAQEALTNVARHAQARACTIALAFDAAALHLEISDDGRGLPAERRAGVGLSSMRERAAELGGTCAIGPAPGGGTRVVAWLPLS